MKYLVTGGAGFIGSTLVDQLLEEGHEVTVLDNVSTGKWENLPSHDKLKIDQDDVSNTYNNQIAKSWEKTTKKFDVIFHLAAEARIQPSFEKPVLTHNSNVTGTVGILELCRKHKARFVYAGSSSVYHDKFANPYTFTKQLAEDYGTLYNRVYDVPVAIARFFNVYGPRQLEEGAYATVLGVFERQKRNDEPLTVTGDGEKRRDFTHVDDIVSGLIAMSKDDWNADIFNLGTGTNHSINEVAEMFDHPITYIAERPGEAQTTLADIQESKSKLGWEPKKCLKEYVDGLLSNK